MEGSTIESSTPPVPPRFHVLGGNFRFLTDDLLSGLPHRPPFRFVDRVDRCDPGRSVTARWRITGDEPWLAGHFPGNPIVPGVLQLEALAQAGAIAVLADPR